MLIANNTPNFTDSPAMDYPIPAGLHAVLADQLDLRTDDEIDKDLLAPKPITSEKNIWLFWHTGYSRMHAYTQRNVRAWHRRFSKQGWTVRVLDRSEGSPLNISNYLDVDDPRISPQAFREGRIGGGFAPQHTSDLVRFPLLLRYGGVYADTGFIQIGDLDRLWNATIGDPGSPFEVLSYNMGSGEEWALSNYFLCSGKNNALFDRCHRLFLALWAEDGGKADTTGMHASPLLKGVPMLEFGAYEDKLDGKKYSAEEASAQLTDYITQGQATSMAMGIVDEEDGWDGPAYVREHVYAVEFLVGAQLINDYTAWDGVLAHRLLNLSLPAPGETERDDQKKAREIVEGCLSRSFGFKLATGIILRMIGPTLSSLWKENEGSDCTPGTYAAWLRFGTERWCPDGIPPNVPFTKTVPIKRGPLLRAA